MQNSSQFPGWRFHRWSALIHCLDSLMRKSKINESDRWQHRQRYEVIRPQATLVGTWLLCTSKYSGELLAGFVSPNKCAKVHILGCKSYIPWTGKKNLCLQKTCSREVVIRCTGWDLRTQERRQKDHKLKVN